MEPIGDVEIILSTSPFTLEGKSPSGLELKQLFCEKGRAWRFGYKVLPARAKAQVLLIHGAAGYFSFLSGGAGREESFGTTFPVDNITFLTRSRVLPVSSM